LATIISTFLSLEKKEFINLALYNCWRVIFYCYLYVEPDIRQDIRQDIWYSALLYIQPDIQYPAFWLAGYPAKSVSGASLVVFKI
jgi:hypothetical protein